MGKAIIHCGASVYKNDFSLNDFAKTGLEPFASIRAIRGQKSSIFGTAVAIKSMSDWRNNLAYKVASQPLFS